MQLPRSTLGWRAIVDLFFVVLLCSFVAVDGRTKTFLHDGRQPLLFSQPGVNEPNSMLAFGGMPYGPQNVPDLQQSSDSGVGAALGAAAVDTLATSLLGAAPPKPPPLVSDGTDGGEGASDGSASDSAVAAQALAEDESIASHADDHSEESEENVGNGNSDSGGVRVAGAVALSAQPLDDIARATLQVEQQTERVRRSSAVKAPPLVSMAICAQAQTKLKALKCSLVTQVSGYPEGCECRVKAKKCPGVDKSLGFTGVSPSIPFSPPQLNGASVILCMYWQWLKPQDRRMEEYYAVQEAKDLATDLVKTANFNAEVGAKAIATPLYGMTPPPLTFTTTYGIPPTPMPIYEPVLFMSTTGFIPFFGNFGPAPGPSAFAYGISFTIRINSINYAMLAANPALTMAFEEILKRSIAQQAGVQPFHVSMRLGAGSVIVQVFISPASGVPDMVIANKLSTSPTFLGVLTNFVNTVPGILAYAIGPITINWISMPSVGLAPWIEAGPSPGPAPGGFLSPFMPFGLSLVPGPAPGPAGPAPAPAPAR